MIIFYFAHVISDIRHQLVPLYLFVGESDPGMILETFPSAISFILYELDPGRSNIIYQVALFFACLAGMSVITLKFLKTSR